MKMNPELKVNWIVALRSGEYEEFRFSFSRVRTLQACAVLKRADPSMIPLRACYLLYLADRKCLLETGTTITGCNMDEQPLYYREVYRVYTLYLVKGNYPIEGAACDELSPYYIELLEGVSAANANLSFDELTTKVYAGPEWTNTLPGYGTCLPGIAIPGIAIRIWESEGVQNISDFIAANNLHFDFLNHMPLKSKEPVDFAKVARRKQESLRQPC